ncbi:cytochrome c oxidase subunit 2A [Macrococcus sp. DPC7161]|uniref:cytochrome c oxidase subunit 2A n=1 Tax=Macrococcus sp. DPC7161 TaxID=2507060 RepID=UPI00100B1DCB|nr:cytochrome c oxidase subunit 2A [Macrococcus sp. DPC7161]RXK19249.1 cytochrome c oxidase subunit 2A [Macrococcus sp. DPC7161]
MNENNVNSKVDTHHDHNELDLRGTMASVLFLGGVFVVTWFAIFILFLERV